MVDYNIVVILPSCYPYSYLYETKKTVKALFKDLNLSSEVAFLLPSKPSPNLHLSRFLAESSLRKKVKNFNGKWRLATI